MSPDDRFARCVNYVCGPTIEGGYVDDPNDRGGPTNHGITQATLADWRGHPVSAADVEALSQEEATEIYQASYWKPICGDELPSGVDLIVFDSAVNQGPGTAAKLLQETVGVSADGHIGPQTLAAVSARDSVDTVNGMSAARLARYKQSPDWPTFHNGWTNRLKAVTAQAIEWC